LVLVRHPLSALCLFVCSVCTISLELYYSIPIIGLILLYVYLGGLIILFSYFWMFHSVSGSINGPYLVLPFLFLLLVFSPSSKPSSLSGLLLYTGLLMFFATLLFIVMLIVVRVLDLRLGRFK